MASETASRERGAAFRTSVFTFEKSCSIGLRSGDACRRQSRWRAPPLPPEILLDVGEEALAIDGSVEQAGRFDPVVTERGEEGRGLPMAVRNLVDEASAFRRPAVEAGHVRLGPSLVDENQARGIDLPLALSPASAVAAHVRPILLTRDERLFLSVTPRWRKKRLITEV